MLFELLSNYGETVGEYGGSLVWAHSYDDIAESYTMSQIFLENALGITALEHKTR